MQKMPSLKTHVPDPTVKIWHIIDGPFGLGDIPEEEWPFIDSYGNRVEDYDEHVYLVAKVEYEGQVSDVEYWFEDFNSAYDVVKKLKTQIDPVVMNNG